MACDALMIGPVNHLVIDVDSAIAAEGQCLFETLLERR